LRLQAAITPQWL